MVWDNKSECCNSYDSFSRELRKVFNLSALGNEVARALSLLHQCPRWLSKYAIEFRMLLHAYTAIKKPFLARALVKMPYLHINC